MFFQRRNKPRFPDWNKEVKLAVGMNNHSICTFPFNDSVGNKLAELVVSVATFIKSFATYNGREVSVDADEGSIYLLCDIVFLNFIYWVSIVDYCFHLEEKEGVLYIVSDDQFLDYLVEQLTITDDMVKHYPMLVPPRPWQTPMEGGYRHLYW
jgi:hypothetical protein